MSKPSKVPTTPVRAQIVAPGSTDRVFELFTEKVGEWWPLDENHSVFGADASTCTLEPREGGRFYETSKQGREAIWGTVTKVSAPDEIQFTWHPSRPAESAQLVTVKFSSMIFGTTVELEHDNWDALGDNVKDLRAAYEKDWPAVLARFAKRAGAR
jgi:uncharacterized protein YndB with AHSA1/START domain